MAAGATIGQIQEFHPESESITAYLERIELFFDANGVADDKKVPSLLSIIGGKTYTLIRSLLAPDLPKDKTFAVLVKTCLLYTSPSPRDATLSRMPSSA